MYPSFEKRQTLSYRGLNGIDFMHINHGEHQVLPQTTYTYNTNTYNFVNTKIEYVQNQSTSVAFKFFRWNIINECVV